MVEHRDTQQRQAEQNEINRDTKQVDGLCRVEAGSGCCRGRICEQDDLGWPPRRQEEAGARSRPARRGIGLAEGFLAEQSMIHWAHAFCVAARPSLDLSLLHAANTRSPFYTATGKKAICASGLMSELGH